MVNRVSSYFQKVGHSAIILLRGLDVILNIDYHFMINVADRGHPLNPTDWGWRICSQKIKGVVSTSSCPFSAFPQHPMPEQGEMHNAISETLVKGKTRIESIPQQHHQYSERSKYWSRGIWL